jgi:single-stranded DNA-specific DHH superfamily exonuclease
MLKLISSFSEEFLKLSPEKEIRIISNSENEGITSTAILIRTFKRLDRKFSSKIIKKQDNNALDEALKLGSEKIIFLINLKISNLEILNQINKTIFIIDNNQIKMKNINEKVKIINPYLTKNIEENLCSVSSICYLFSKKISKENSDLSKIALIGIVNNQKISKIDKKIMDDTEELTIKKGLVLYPATRPLKRVLEYSISPYIPGVTGSGQGASELLRETRISENKSLTELDEEEMSRLVDGILIKGINKEKINLGEIYTLKFFNVKEDLKEISVLINACTKLGHSDTAIAYCLENEKAKVKAIDICTRYRQDLVSGIKVAEEIEKISGKGFVILNAKDRIKEAIVGTVCSILSSAPKYEEGTILIGMAYNKDKIKVSARMAGKKGRDIKEVLERTMSSYKTSENEILVGGHSLEAGCLVEKSEENKFIEALKKNLEIEIVKI